jgi:hypothetical protein
MATGREKLRVAHALKHLPAVSAAFGRGELSYSKVRAITRIGDAHNEEFLLGIAHYGTASQLERLVRTYRRCRRLQEAQRAGRQREERSVTWYYDDDGMLVLSARLPPEDGALVLKALDGALDEEAAFLRRRTPDRAPAEASAAAVENVSVETPSGHQPVDNVSAEAPRAGQTVDNVSAETSAAPAPEEPQESYAMLRADALARLAETYLAHGPKDLSGGERYEVVVHVERDVLTKDADGRCEIEDGTWIAAETARRLACDCSIVAMLDDPDGNPLNVGRRTRSIPPALRRALRARDEGCRFPGCTRRRFTDGHHIHHWVNGGETKLDNLVSLCRRHHRLVHEGGWGVVRRDDGTLAFTGPKGGIPEWARLPVIDPATTIETLNAKESRLYQCRPEERAGGAAVTG